MNTNFNNSATIAPNQPSYSQFDASNSEYEQALEFLWALDSRRADSYEEWIKVGQCLHSVDDDLLDHWDEWSQQSDSYKSHKDCQTHWNSFKDNGGRTIATLCQMAKEDGWQPSKDSKHSMSKGKTKPYKAHKVTLAKFPDDTKLSQPEYVTKEDGTIECKYNYSEKHYTYRVKPPNEKKVIKPYTINADGKHENSKGDNIWEAYRINEALKHGLGKYILAVEGEKCVDAARSILRLVTISWQGGYSEVEIQQSILQLKNSGIAGLIYFPDNDNDGESKAKKVTKICNSLDFDCILIDPKNVWADIPLKGDIADWIQEYQEKMERPEFIKRLEEAIHLAVDGEQTQKETPSTLPIKEAISQAKSILQKNLSETDENVELEELRLKTGISDYSWQNNYVKPLRKEVQKNRLRLEVNNYLKETDIIERLILKQKICTHYQLAKDDFLKIVQDFEWKQNTPEEKVYSFDDFIDEDSEELSWVVPGFLPLGETIILAALAKVGKSQLAMDVAHAVISNGEVLGEKVQNSGGVLMVTTDESPNSTKRRLRSRGFKSLPKEMTQNLRVMPHLSITDLTKLEEELETQRPNLVIIDSLTSITKDLGISENDSEFARHIYLLKELISRYNSSCILIHHENKDKEAKGINKLAGNTRISASVWGIWQLKGNSQEEEEGGTVTLSLTAREAESTTVTLERNPQGLWASEGIFKFIGDSSDPSNTKRTYAEKIYSLLKSYAPKGLEYVEIKDSLDIDSRTLSTVLNRMVNRKQITYRESHTNKGKMVYAVRSGESDSQNSPPPPPPSQSSRTVDKEPETTTNKGIETPQHPINTPSTGHQQLSTAFSNGGTVNQVLTEVLTSPNSDIEGDTATCQQQSPIETGGEGSVNNKADSDSDKGHTPKNNEFGSPEIWSSSVEKVKYPYNADPKKDQSWHSLEGVKGQYLKLKNKFNGEEFWKSIYFCTVYTHRNTKIKKGDKVYSSELLWSGVVRELLPDQKVKLELILKDGEEEIVTSWKCVPCQWKESWLQGEMEMLTNYDDDF